MSQEVGYETLIHIPTDFTDAGDFEIQEYQYNYTYTGDTGSLSGYTIVYGPSNLPLVEMQAGYLKSTYKKAFGYTVQSNGSFGCMPEISELKTFTSIVVENISNINITSVTVGGVSLPNLPDRAFFPTDGFNPTWNILPLGTYDTIVVTVDTHDLGGRIVVMGADGGFTGGYQDINESGGLEYTFPSVYLGCGVDFDPVHIILAQSYI